MGWMEICRMSKQDIARVIAGDNEKRYRELMVLGEAGVKW